MLQNAKQGMGGRPGLTRSANQVHVVKHIPKVNQCIKNIETLRTTAIVFQQFYSCMCTTAGVLEPPLGSTRLQVIKLVTTLILSNSSEVTNELVQLGTVKLILVSCLAGWKSFHEQILGYMKICS